MSNPRAAIPSRRVEPRTEFKAQPADAQIAVCPMCGDPDNLILDMPTVRLVRIKAWMVGVTEAEYEEVAEEGVQEQNKPPTSIRCLICKWKYTGPQCMSRLIASADK